MLGFLRPPKLTTFPIQYNRDSSRTFAIPDFGRGPENFPPDFEAPRISAKVLS